MEIRDRAYPQGPTTIARNHHTYSKNFPFLLALEPDTAAPLTSVLQNCHLVAGNFLCRLALERVPCHTVAVRYQANAQNTH